MSSKNSSSAKEQTRTAQNSLSHQTQKTTKDTGILALRETFAPLHARNFRLLFSGQFISSIGDAFYWVALPWFILNNGGGAQGLGFALTAYGVPRIVTILLGGPLSDRLQPRRMMLLSDTARFLLTGILAMVLLQGHAPLWILQ